MTIDTLVLPVAGLGTRFLPATKVVPKELMPVLDKPLIQLVVEEAHRAGIRHVILVTSGSKRALEDHFDLAAELETVLRQRNKLQMLEVVRNTLPEGMTVSAVRQPKALGLGHAVLMARPIIGNKPFAVALPDDLIDDRNGPGCLADMVALHRTTGRYSLAVEEVPRDKTDKYGVVSVGGENRIVGIVEKPRPEEAPSTLAVVGRYVLPGEIFEALSRTAPGAGGEIQLTDGIAALLPEFTFAPHRFQGMRYDCGSKMGFLQANYVFGIRDVEVGEQFRDWLRTQA